MVYMYFIKNVQFFHSVPHISNKGWKGPTFWLWAEGYTWWGLYLLSNALPFLIQTQDLLWFPWIGKTFFFFLHVFFLISFASTCSASNFNNVGIFIPSRFSQNALIFRWTCFMNFLCCLHFKIECLYFIYVFPERLIFYQVIFVSS